MGAGRVLALLVHMQCEVEAFVLVWGGALGLVPLGLGVGWSLGSCPPGSWRGVEPWVLSPWVSVWGGALCLVPLGIGVGWSLGSCPPGCAWPCHVPRPVVSQGWNV